MATGGDGGRRPFFNDRRFTVAGPQRLRQNVQDLLSQFNRQFASDNPHLLHELADQLNRLQDLLTTSPNGNQNQTQNAPLNNAAAIGVRQNRNTIDGAGPSNSQNDSLAAFENDVSGNEGRFLSDDDERDDDESNENGRSINFPQANDSVILNMEHEEGNGHIEGIALSEDGQQEAAAPAQQTPGQGAATNADPDAEWQRLVASFRAPEVQRILRTILNFGPFVFILFLKWIFTYAASIVMLFTLVLTFFYVESVVEKVIAASRTQQISKWRLLPAFVLLIANIGALQLFFADEQLYMALLFQPSTTKISGHVSFTSTLWEVVTMDFLAKFLFMMVKCLVASIPSVGSTHRRKAQTYQWLEYTSHMYRHWLPTLPWSYYLTDTSAASTYVHNGLCTALFLIYLVLKIKLFSPKLSRWWKSCVSLLRPTSFGFSPSTTELMKTGPTCSICYGEYANPVQLSCKHIFCDECVTTWLDKQKTCPMCRTQVITGDNDWKDGKTSYCIQLV